MNNEYDFEKIESKIVSKPRNICWNNWAKFEKVGDSVKGYIRDVFYKKADGQYDDARGITLEQPDGKLINVSIKRLPFVLSSTDNLRLGDPLMVKLTELKKSETKGFSPTKILTFYGENLPENAGNKTVMQLDDEDRELGGSGRPPEAEKPKEDIMPEAQGIEAKDVPFP